MTEQGAMGKNWNIEISIQTWGKKKLYFEGDRTMKHIAKRGCEVSSSEDIQSPPRYFPM